MSYNTVHTWSAYEVVTAANMNNNDENLDYLKGRADRCAAVFTVIPADDAIATGTGKFRTVIPNFADGMDITTVGAAVHTVSSSGVVTVDINNDTTGLSVLSPKLTVDANEYTSETAATAAGIVSARKTVSVGDRFSFDVDTAGTGAEGLDVYWDLLLS